MMKMKQDNLYLKKTEGKKDLEIKKYKRRAKSFLVLLLIIGAVLIIQVGGDFVKKFQEVAVVDNNDNNCNNNNFYNQTGNQTKNQIGNQTFCVEPTFAKQIIFFMDKLFLYPSSFWTKFFIFLGIIYITQIVFGLAFDVIEIILLMFVAIKRIIKWIYRKITGKDGRGQNLRKIEELYEKKVN